MHIAGGRVSIMISGVAYSARGEIKLNPSRISADVGTNQDGTIYKTIKPKPTMAECTFDRFVDNNGTPLAWDDSFMLLKDLSATFVEQDTSITHLLNSSTFVGDPEINLGNGEVSGLKIAGDGYKSV